MKQAKKIAISLLIISVLIIASFSLISVKANNSSQQGPHKRADIEENFKWNLTDIYENDSLWEEDFKKLQNELIPKMSEFTGKLSTPEAITNCFQARDKLFWTLEKVYVYAKLKKDEDNSVTQYKEMLSRAESIYSQASKSIAFIQPEIIELPEDTLNKLAQDPSLKDYKLFFESVKTQKEHTLSKNEEELLASAGEFANTPEDIYNNITLGDLKYPKIKDKNGNEIQLSNGTYSKLVEEKDREFRKKVFEEYFTPWNNFKNSLAATLFAQVKKDIFFAKAKKYNSSLEAALDSTNIPVEVYNTLVDSANKNAVYFQKYIELRKKVLKLDKVHSYDMSVPLVDNISKDIPFEEGKTMILETLKPLGSEYLDYINKAFNERWIDVYETENKETGAYQFQLYPVHPYILTNYTNNIDSVSTLVHELGHAVNSCFVKSAQPYSHSDVPIFNAEIASTANEILLAKYLINNAKSDEEKLYFINNYIDLVRGTFYIQTMLAQFEEEAHKKVENGEALSADSLNQIWKSLLEKYNGENYAVDDIALCAWSRISHFYSSFYVYKYATSIAAANEIVKNITEGDNKEQAIQNYIEFLKSGSSDYPVEILKKAGVDATKGEYIEHLLKDFGYYVDEMEKLLTKLGKI